MSLHVLAINPGSTSTKAALYRDGEQLAYIELAHDKKRLLSMGSVNAQMGLRMEALRTALAEKMPEGLKLDAVVGRGGLLRPLPGGVYGVSHAMIADLASNRYGEHPCNLGALMALEIAEEHGCPAYVVDPVVTDEMADVARLTGLPELPRRSIFHALSQRGAARKAAEELGIRYEKGKFIVAHMGGGISLGAHDHGKVVDVINALDGEGPFSPERAGRLPVVTGLSLIEQGRYTPGQLKEMALKKGGLWAHLGTSDLREVERRIDAGDTHARQVYESMAYFIARHIASLAPALLYNEGCALDAVVLTGGMARSKRLVELVRSRVAFLGRVIVVTGTEEMQVMADGALRALRGEEEVKAY